jgi:hypothetical protein
MASEQSELTRDNRDRWAPSSGIIPGQSGIPVAAAPWLHDGHTVGSGPGDPGDASVGAELGRFLAGCRKLCVRFLAAEGCLGVFEPEEIINEVWPELSTLAPGDSLMLRVSRLIRRTVRRWARRQRREITVPDVGDGLADRRATPLEIVIARDLLEHLLENLTETQRATLHAQVATGGAFKETRKTLGISPWALYRRRQRLRDLASILLFDDERRTWTSENRN